MHEPQVHRNFEDFLEFSISVYFIYIFAQECAPILDSLSTKSICLGNVLLPYDDGYSFIPSVRLH